MTLGRSKCLQISTLLEWHWALNSAVSADSLEFNPNISIQKKGKNIKIS